MLQALRQNFGLKLFSLALAVGGWAYFRFLAAPSLTAQFDERLGVPLGGSTSRAVQRALPVGVHYTGDLRSLVVTRVDITPSDVVASGAPGDLGRIREIRVQVPIPNGAGTYDAMLPLQVVAPGTGPGSIDVAPNLVRVRVDFTQPGT